MKQSRAAGLVLGSILLALCFILIVLSVTPAAPVEEKDAYLSAHHALKLEPLPLPTGGVNINTAGLEELDRLPGIGPVTAQAIIDERESGGPFYYPEDLLSVRGIGEKTLEKLRHLISTGEEP